jgi:hypothetical protein
MMSYRYRGMGGLGSALPSGPNWQTCVNDGGVLISGSDMDDPTVTWAIGPMFVVGPSDAPVGPILDDANGHPITTGTVYPINLNSSCQPVPDLTQPMPNPLGPVPAQQAAAAQAAYNLEVAAAAANPMTVVPAGSTVTATPSGQLIVNSSGAGAGSSAAPPASGSMVTSNGGGGSTQQMSTGSWFTDSMFDGIPNWGLVAAAAVALFLVMGGAHGK